MFSLIYILGVLFFLRSGIRGTKPHSFVLYGEDESGKPIDWPERIAWGLLGLMFLSLGALRVLPSRIPTGHL